jgi:hypothetical protein
MTKDTHVTLREYVDTRFEATQYNIGTTAQQLEKRLDGMNEFREQLNAQATTFISRVEVEDKIKTRTVVEDTLSERINVNEQKISNLEGRSWAVGFAFSIVTVGISIALHFIK